MEKISSFNSDIISIIKDALNTGDLKRDSVHKLAAKRRNLLDEIDYEGNDSEDFFESDNFDDSVLMNISLLNKLIKEEEQKSQNSKNSEICTNHESSKDLKKSLDKLFKEQKELEKKNSEKEKENWNLDKKNKINDRNIEMRQELIYYSQLYLKYSKKGEAGIKELNDYVKDLKNEEKVDPLEISKCDAKETENKGEIESKISDIEKFHFEEKRKICENTDHEESSPRLKFLNSLHGKYTNAEFALFYIENDLELEADDKNHIIKVKNGTDYYLMESILNPFNIDPAFHDIASVTFYSRLKSDEEINKHFEDLIKIHKDTKKRFNDIINPIKEEERFDDYVLSWERNFPSKRYLIKKYLKDKREEKNQKPDEDVTFSIDNIETVQQFNSALNEKVKKIWENRKSIECWLLKKNKKNEYELFYPYDNIYEKIKEHRRVRLSTFNESVPRLIQLNLKNENFEVAYILRKYNEEKIDPSDYKNESLYQSIANYDYKLETSLNVKKSEKIPYSGWLFHIINNIIKNMDFSNKPGKGLENFENNRLIVPVLVGFLNVK